MRQLPLTLLGTALLSLCAVALAAAPAKRVVGADVANPDQRVLPGGNYSVIRHSKFDKIDTSSVDNLHVARAMSTGTLRG
jgi:hypothetical protein